VERQAEAVEQETNTKTPTLFQQKEAEQHTTKTIMPFNLGSTVSTAFFTTNPGPPKSLLSLLTPVASQTSK